MTSYVSQVTIDKVTPYAQVTRQSGLDPGRGTHIFIDLYRSRKRERCLTVLLKHPYWLVPSHSVTVSLETDALPNPNPDYLTLILTT